MPGQVIPIQDLASTGVILDTPSISLPPNAFSNVENVRFHDGAVRKMEGEVSISLTPSRTFIHYIAYWERPTLGPVYIVVHGETTHTLSLHNLDGSIVTESLGTIAQAAGFDYQHTTFNGGFHIIINNGTGTPVFVQENIAAASVLPNWDSYQSQVNSLSVEFSAQYADLSLGRALGDTSPGIADNNVVVDVQVTLVPRDTSLPIVVATIADFGGTTAFVGDATRNATLNTQDSDNDFPYVNINPSPATGDLVSVSIIQRPSITVTAGVVRAYGNLLVAGDLTESGAGGAGRTLPGMIRTSDVAAPGSIPTNWNPFQNGVNTADEFVLASTGRVRDMAELQGVLYVYTDSSIHGIQQTGNPTIPFQITTVTDSYGADNTGSVLEVDGKHIVVGSDDVYVFAGHPGSISSISDSRVRYQPFFDDGRVVKLARFQRYDELWFWSPNDGEMFIWNYRDNTWTRRDLTAPVSVNSIPGGLILATVDDAYTADSNTFTDLAGAAYSSFVERRRLALAPEFDTETLGSVALLYSGTSDLLLDFNTSNAPGAREVPFVAGVGDPFTALTSWKTDIRVTGRFLNYRIGDSSTSTEWNISGMQFDIGKGGTR